jgi:hypothetical protein
VAIDPVVAQVLAAAGTGLGLALLSFDYNDYDFYLSWQKPATAITLIIFGAVGAGSGVVGWLAGHAVGVSTQASWAWARGVGTGAGGHLAGRVPATRQATRTDKTSALSGATRQARRALDTQTKKSITRQLLKMRLPNLGNYVDLVLKQNITEVAEVPEKTKTLFQKRFNAALAGAVANPPGAKNSLAALGTDAIMQFRYSLTPQEATAL